MGGCLFQWCTVALYPNVLVVSIKKNRRRDWFGFGDGAAWGLVCSGSFCGFSWILGRCLLARDGHRMSLASLALKQRKMYFQHTKDTASAQSLKETVQQRKKLGGTLRFGRYYLLPVTCISSNYPGPGGVTKCPLKLTKKN